MKSLKSREKVSDTFKDIEESNKVLVKLQRARKERLRLIELDTTLAKKGHVTPDNRSSKASMLHRAATREAYMYSLKVQM